MLITIAEAHNRLSHWINRLKDTPVIITRRGKPIGVMVDPDEYERLRQVQAYLQMLHLADELRDCDMTASELFDASREELEGQQ